MRVLVVEDNKHVADALNATLRGTYIVDVENSGHAALANINIPNYDVILLDLGLTDMSGQEVCQQLRAKKITTPIIIVTGDDAATSKVKLLDTGADDYITKPFNGDELKARIRAVMRRDSQKTTPANFVVGDLELDPANRTVLREGRQVKLRRKEFDLLEYMMRNPGRALSRQMVIDHVWENSDGLWTNAVDVHIKCLRDKVDRPFTTRLIKTVYGVGYKLDVPVTEGMVANT